jgi:hypothetical protein
MNTLQHTPVVDRGDRTYHVSDERLRAFANLTVAERLQWVERCSQCQETLCPLPVPGLLESIRAGVNAQQRAGRARRSLRGAA